VAVDSCTICAGALGENEESCRPQLGRHVQSNPGRRGDASCRIKRQNAPRKLTIVGGAASLDIMARREARLSLPNPRHLPSAVRRSPVPGASSFTEAHSPNEVQGSVLSTSRAGAAEDCAYVPVGDYRTGVSRPTGSAWRRRSRGAAARARGHAFAWPRARRAARGPFDASSRWSRRTRARHGGVLHARDARADQATARAPGHDRVQPQPRPSPTSTADHTTRTYADRLASWRGASGGFNVCCGGIIGMGKHQARLGLLSSCGARRAPESVPINSSSRSRGRRGGRPPQSVRSRAPRRHAAS